MGNLLGKISGGLGTAVQWLALAGGVVLLWLMGLTVIAVVMRKVFQAPILGVQDLSEASMALVVFGGLAYGGWTGGHIAINLIGVVIKGRGLNLVDTAVKLVCAAFFALAAWITVIKGLESREMGDASNLIFIPHFPFFFAVAFGMALYAVVLLTLALRALYGFPDIKNP